MNYTIESLKNQIQQEKDFIQMTGEEDYKGHALLLNSATSCPISIIERIVEENLTLDIELIPLIEVDGLKNVDWKVYHINQIEEVINKSLNKNQDKTDKINKLKKISEEKGVNIQEFLDSLSA